jgi:hypothetical protein
MNLFLALAQLYLPSSIRKSRLEKLFACTASAFGFDPPPLDGLVFEECLMRYAEFSKIWAEEALRRGETEPIRQQLQRGAYALGQELRAQFHVANREEAMRAARLVYRVIGIELRGEAQGKITISSCFFSGYYSPSVCQLVSALDEGILSGLSNGGRLTFTQRITEGCDCCRAALLWQGEA